jgi:hypothetical protein
MGVSTNTDRILMVERLFDLELKEVGKNDAWLDGGGSGPMIACS